MLTALQNCAGAWGNDPDKPNDEGVIIWDISDPLNPKQLSHWKTGSTGVIALVIPGDDMQTSLPTSRLRRTDSRFPRYQ